MYLQYELCVQFLNEINSVCIVLLFLILGELCNLKDKKTDLLLLLTAEPFYSRGVPHWEKSLSASGTYRSD